MDPNTGRDRKDHEKNSICGAVRSRKAEEGQDTLSVSMVDAMVDAIVDAMVENLLQ